MNVKDPIKYMFFRWSFRTFFMTGSRFRTFVITWPQSSAILKSNFFWPKYWLNPLKYSWGAWSAFDIIFQIVVIPRKPWERGSVKCGTVHVTLQPNTKMLSIVPHSCIKDLTLTCIIGAFLWWHYTGTLHMKLRVRFFGETRIRIQRNQRIRTQRGFVSFFDRP